MLEMCVILQYLPYLPSGWVSNLYLEEVSPEFASSGMWLPTVAANGHIQRISSQLGPLDRDNPTVEGNVQYVFLCFTNRCGSNHVAELIGSSGVYNLAGEILNWDSVINHADRYHLSSLREVFLYYSKTYARNGYLFVKCAVSQIELLGKAGILSEIIGNSKFLLIERGDRLSQAISYIIAFGTGRFTSQMKGGRAEELVFSFEKIDNTLESICKENKMFDLFFARNGLVPINIIYEQLLADTRAYMHFVSNQLCLPHPIDIDTSKLKWERQAGSVNADWRERYLQARPAS